MTKAAQNPAEVDDAPEQEADTRWSVIDTNASKAPGGMREHEPIPGQKYKLRADEATKMPQGHALKFLVASSFQVFNELGQPVAAMAEGAQERQVDLREHLRSGEVIADLKELSKPALLARAARYPGGERFKKNSKLEEVIEFITESMAGQNRVVSDMQSDGETDPLGAAGAKSILPSLDEQLQTA